MGDQTFIRSTGGIEDLYKARFAPHDLARKDRVWRILCEHFFNRYIGRSDRVLDIAAGYCEFINHIKCGEKYALDLNPDTSRFAATDVQLVIGDCRDMSPFGSIHFDVVFISNFFEHLESKHDIDLVLRGVYEHLRPGGRLLVLQPNIRYVGARYWDFYDHCIPLTHISMREALEKNGFRVELVIPRFLPYTFKSKIPNPSPAVRFYLMLPILWRLLGKQMFVIAVKPEI